MSNININNVDMSEIIEFVMPNAIRYSEQTQDHDNDSVEEVMEGNTLVDMAHAYGEEFLLVNEDGTVGELLQLQEHELVNCAEEPDEDDDEQYLLSEQAPEDALQHFIKGETEIGGEDEILDEQIEHYEQFDEQIEDENVQPEPGYNYHYVQSTSPTNEAQALEFDEIQQYSAENSEQSFQQQHEYLNNEEDDYEEVDAPDTNLESEPAKPIQPSDKMLDTFKGPRRYMLFDDLIATIVDFDEHGTPIVEFSMICSTSDEKLPVECGICPDVMAKSKLAKHQKIHLVPGTNRYACIYCTETYRDCKYLAGHARRHMGIRPYVCEPCKLYFSTKQDLRVHNQRRHLEKEHICEMCGHTFAQYTRLKRHREATHEKKRRFSCPHCPKAYYKNFSLQEHIRNVHMGKRRMLKCPFCGMQCRDAHKMARHRKEMHLNQDSYECHLCNEEFTDINYFDAHKRSIQCRSNTRRQRIEDAATAGTSTSGGNLESDDLAAMGMEEDYDEDAGLMVEGSDSNAIYETVSGSYIQLQDVEDDPSQFAEQFEYEDEVLLVEEVAEGDEILEEQYNPQQQQQVDPEYNDNELVYEITLETEDN